MPLSAIHIRSPHLQSTTHLQLPAERESAPKGTPTRSGGIPSIRGTLHAERAIVECGEGMTRQAGLWKSCNSERAIGARAAQLLLL